MHKDLPDVWYTYVPNKETWKMLVNKLIEVCVREPFYLYEGNVENFYSFPMFMASCTSSKNSVSFYNSRCTHMLGEELTLRNILELEIDKEEDKKEEKEVERLFCECGHCESIEKIEKALKKDSGEEIKKVFKKDHSHSDSINLSFLECMTIITVLERIAEKFNSKFICAEENVMDRIVSIFGKFKE